VREQAPIGTQGQAGDKGSRRRTFVFRGVGLVVAGFDSRRLHHQHIVFLIFSSPGSAGGQILFSLSILQRVDQGLVCELGGASGGCEIPVPEHALHHALGYAGQLEEAREAHDEAMRLWLRCWIPRD
jgi:hypothetical protein